MTITGLDLVEDLTAGGGHACARENGGQLRCWGAGGHGELGTGGTSDSPTPASPRDSAGPLANVSRAAAGAQHSCVVRGADVLCFGTGLNGRLGNGGTADQPLGVAAALSCQ
jgi:alpha-tubulin suppressor-like RCC1 family protein